MKYYVGIDLGGTFIKAGVVDENCNIVAKASIPSAVDGDHEGLADRMVECAKMAMAELGMTIDDVESVGIGTPGAIDSKNGLVVYANNLEMKNTPLGEYMRARINKPVYVENDANVAAYGEALAGAAAGIDNVVVITLGTGVGGGIIIDGKIYTGFNQFGGELGHAVVEYNGWPCTCGRKGCMEVYSSATGLIKMTRIAMAENPKSKLWEVAPTMQEVNGKTAFDAMRMGDEAGTAVVDKYINYLACGLANYVNIFQPEVLLIGGGICKEGETLLAPLRKLIAKEAYSIDGQPTCDLRVCKLGNDAGTIGAAMLWKQH
ncbi:MAG: ROK family glucokinase [Oscillospiraceae bacterium]|nr:ROK family glucokinase [Oscillospiraceae bacterium]